MFKRSELAEKIRSKKPVIGIWMQIPHPMVAEALSQTGFDFILLDGEHAPVPPDVLGGLLPSTELHGMPVLYRVRSNTNDLIKSALDHGVSAVMVPMVNSAKEAAAAIAAAKYPPLGRRGIGPWRASNYYLNKSAYVASANSDTATVLQIESREALNEIDNIAATPGVNVLYVGPADLALSLGLVPGKLHPDLVNACRRVAEAARRNGIAAGIDVASLDFVKTYRELGFTLMTHGLDTSFLIEGGRHTAKILRGAIEA